jgi:lipoprotein signal peptidase
MLLTMVGTVAVDHVSKALARSRHVSALTFHVDHVAGLHGLMLVLAGLGVIAATAVLRPRAPTWIYGGGLALGGGLANLLELEWRGSVTDFIPYGDSVACPADVAIVLGVALWWSGGALRVLRGVIPSRG